MPRAIWTGTLQFALISFPVKLYKSTDSKGVSFKTFHTECGSSIHLKKWCEICNREVLKEELAKGYELGKGQFALFTDEEVDAALPENVKAIKIEKVIPADEIPVITYETSYFLAPDKGGEHIYSLLFNALSIKPKVLVGRVVMRNKEHLVAVRPYSEGLLLNLLHFAVDVRDINEVVYIKEKAIDKKELDLAISLLDYLTGSFNDIDQKDKFREYIDKIAEMKATGQVITVEPAKPITPKASILEGLQKSIEMLKAGGGVGGGSIGGTVAEPIIEKITVAGVTEKIEAPQFDKTKFGVVEIKKGIEKPAEVKHPEVISLKEQINKLFGVTEEEINKLILEQKIEDEEERIKTLKELTIYKSFKEYVAAHEKEFELLEIGDNFQSITILDEKYPRINLPILKKIGIVAKHFGVLIYIKSKKAEMEKLQEKKDGIIYL